MVLGALFSYTFGVVGAVFAALDTPYSNLDGFSLLDIFISLLLLDAVIDLFLSLMDAHYDPIGEDDDIEEV